MTDASVTPGKKFDNQRLIFYAMLLSSAALSIVSAYETYIGLLDFMGTTFFGRVASAILTFGIQVLLFAISWSIANHLKDGFRANIPRWTIWVLCAFFSGYFSYYGFFETTGGRNDDIRMSAVNKEASDLYLSVEERLTAVLEEEHVALIAGDDADEYRAWTTNSLRAIIEVANDPRVESRIANAARQARATLVSELETLRNDLSPLLIEAATVRVTLNQSNATLESARDRKAELESTLAEVRAELSDAQASVTSLQAQYDQESSNGVGPRALEISRDLNSARGVANGLVQRQSDADAELTSLLPELARLEAVAEVGVEQTRINEIDSDITEIQSEIVRVEKELEDATLGVSFDFRTQTQDYERFEAAFANKDYSKLEDLINQCAVLKQQLTEAGLAADVQEVSCSNTVISQGTTRLQALQSNLQSYRGQCMGERPQPVRASADEPAQIDGVIAHLNGCMDFIAAPRERDTFKSRVATLNTQRGDDVEPITEASVALFRDRQGNAVMSAIFAIIVDVLVLFCALVGLNVGLPERARAIDLLLNRARKPEGAGPNVEKQVNIGNMEPNKQALVDPVVSDLLRQGLAEYTDDAGTQLNLLRGATIRLTQMRKQEVSEASDALEGMSSGRSRSRTSARGGGPRMDRD